MNQITMRQLVRQSSQLQDWLPCELVRDGEVIALIISPNVSHDVRQTTRTSTMSDKLKELPLSKRVQSSGQMARL